MSSPFLGEIRIFAGNFAPKGWATCDGQILSIAQNTALFSLLGTTYGGNGTTNFALPNFQGSAPMHAGSGPGLTPRSLGETGGEGAVTLLTSQIPQHTHSFQAGSGGRGNVNTPPGNVPSSGQTGDLIYATTAASIPMNPAMIQPAPASQPHENRQPYQCLTFIIALQGIFPSRN